MDPAEVGDLRALLEAHLEIERDHGHERLEFDPEVWAGFTAVVPGFDPGHDEKPTAIVFMCALDAVASHGDTAIVLEHKTSETRSHHEADMFAVSAAVQHRARTGRPVDSVEVHHHYLRRDQDRCDLSTYTRDEIQAAAERLAEVVGPLGMLDPGEPTHARPKDEADGECRICEFRGRCQRWGGPGLPHDWVES